MTLPLDNAPGPSADEESERHALVSRDFVVKAREELDKGELLQASEKAWGAAAHAIKAVAEKRRWFSEADWKLRRAASVISDEIGDNSLMGYYLFVRDAHYNYYHHLYSTREVEQAISAAEALVGMIESTLAPGYIPPFVSDSLDETIHSLEQPTSEPDRDRLTNGRPPMEQRPPAVPSTD